MTLDCLIPFCLLLLIMILSSHLCLFTEDLYSPKIKWSKSWAVDFNSEKTINTNFTRIQSNNYSNKIGYSGDDIKQPNVHVLLG